MKINTVKNIKNKLLRINNKKGMEMVQVAILVAIAIGLGLIFKVIIYKII